jgi:acyl-CoA hydrolase
MDAKPVADSRVLLSHWMGPLDANSSGNVHGGTIMKLADEAAALAAIKHARTLVTTAGVDRMAFLVPVFVGDLVTFKAMVNAAWRTSMEIGVRVEAENPLTGEVRHTNSAYFTFVALDEQRGPTPVPPATAATPTDQRRLREAEIRRSNRLAERAGMLARRSEEGDF